MKILVSHLPTVYHHALRLIYHPFCSTHPPFQRLLPSHLYWFIRGNENSNSNILQLPTIHQYNPFVPRRPKLDDNRTGFPWTKRPTRYKSVPSASVPCMHKSKRIVNCRTPHRGYRIFRHTKHHITRFNALLSEDGGTDERSEDWILTTRHILDVLCQLTADGAQLHANEHWSRYWSPTAASSYHSRRHHLTRVQRHY